MENNNSTYKDEKKINKSFIFEKIIDKVKYINKDKERADTLSNIANSIKNSDVENKEELYSKLIERAEIISDDFYRYDVIKNITTEISSTKDIKKDSLFNKIIEYSNYIYNYDNKASAFISILINLPKTGVENKLLLFDKLIDYSIDINVDELKSNVIIVITKKLASIKVENSSKKLPLFDKIVKIMKNIENKFKSTTYSKILKELVINQINEISIYDKIFESTKSVPLNKIKYKIFKKIITELSNIELKDENTFVTKSIVLDKTIDSVKEMYSDKSKSILYASIAKEVSKLKDVKDIDKISLFDKIINYSKNIKNESQRADTFEEICTYLAKTAYYEKAIEIIDEIGFDKQKSIVLNKIAIELSKNK